jgi:hypothetical protein
MPPSHTTPSRKLLAELTALADGSLPAARREDVKRQIEASDELRVLFGREQRAVEMLRRAREQDRAPDSLRQRIAARRPTATQRVAWRPVVPGLGLAAAVAILVVILSATSGPSGGPSVAQAAAVAARGPVAAAPGPDPTHPMYALAQTVGELYFPNWQRPFGAKATGVRSDRVGGRKAVTVYYSLAGRDIAYTIVASPALRQPRARAVRVGSIQVRALKLGARTTITWRRDGHTCILASRNISVRRLDRLAAWAPIPLEY